MLSTPANSINLQPAHLQNNLVRLVPLQPGDFEALYAVAADPAIWEQHPQRDRYKREVFQGFFDGAVQSGSAFLVYDVASGALIGSSRFYDYDATARTIAVGYTFLAKAYWGGRYNSALKQLMLHYAFGFADTVVLHIGPNNIRSQKAAEKIGAQRNDAPTFDANGEPRLEYIIQKEAYLARFPM